MLDRDRMKRPHRAPQAIDPLVNALHRPDHPGAPRACLGEILLCGKQGLQRTVMEILGDPAPCVLLRRDHLQGEMPPFIGESDQLCPVTVAAISGRDPAIDPSAGCRQAPQPKGDHSLLPSPDRGRQPRPHSSSPRRIASATAAARSPTSSFA